MSTVVAPQLENEDRVPLEVMDATEITQSQLREAVVHS